jgi:hypothetical protein
LAARKSSDQLVVVPLLTRIKLKEVCLEGRITAICVRPCTTSYEMQYFDGNNERKTMWVEEWEFETAKPRTTLGLKNDSSN